MSQLLISSRFIIRTLLLSLVLILLIFALFPELRQNNLLWQSVFGDPSKNNKPISFADAVARSGPAVVNIYTIVGIDQQHSLVNTRARNVHRLGSGVIASDKGFILTAAHVVQNGEVIEVALQDGRTFQAQLIGIDTITDIAVLYIEADNLPVIPYNPKNDTRAGDLVLAIGNPYNLGQTITQGIVSATGRSGLNSAPDINLSYDDFIQLDAAINDGNSGGAIVNSLGELVGISSAQLTSRRRNTAQGIFFAVTAPLAYEIMEKIIAEGRVVRGYLGISGRNQQSISGVLPNGITVTEVDPYGPASEAGIKEGDVISKINDKEVVSATTALSLIEKTKPGTVIKVGVLRRGVSLNIEVIIAELPDYNYQ